MYHYDGVPASAEKKVLVAENDIKTLYDKFKDLSLKDKTTEETAGADVTLSLIHILSLHTHKNSTPAVGVCTIFAGFIILSGR